MTGNEMKKEKREKMEELSRKRIKDAVKGVATIINKNESIIQDLEWACQQEEWNEDVVFQLKDAQLLLGQALATLTNWFSDEEGEDDD